MKALGPDDTLLGKVGFAGIPEKIICIQFDSGNREVKALGPDDTLLGKVGFTGILLKIIFKTAPHNGVVFLLQKVRYTKSI